VLKNRFKCCRSPSTSARSPCTDASRIGCNPYSSRAPFNRSWLCTPSLHRWPHLTELMGANTVPTNWGSCSRAAAVLFCRCSLSWSSSRLSSGSRETASLTEKKACCALTRQAGPSKAPTAAAATALSSYMHAKHLWTHGSASASHAANGWPHIITDCHPGQPGGELCKAVAIRSKIAGTLSPD